MCYCFSIFNRLNILPGFTKQASFLYACLCFCFLFHINYDPEHIYVWLPCRLLCLLPYPRRTAIMGQLSLRESLTGAALLRLPVTLDIESLNCSWPPKPVIRSRQGGRVMLCLGPEPVASPHTGPTLPALSNSMHTAWHIVSTQ